MDLLFVKSIFFAQLLMVYVQNAWTSIYITRLKEQIEIMMEEVLLSYIYQESCTVFLDQLSTFKSLNIQSSITVHNEFITPTIYNNVDFKSWNKSMLVPYANQKCSTFIISTQDICGTFSFIYKAMRDSNQKKGTYFFVMQLIEVSSEDYIRCKWISFFPFTYILHVFDDVETQPYTKFRVLTHNFQHDLKPEKLKEVNPYLISLEKKKLHNLNGISIRLLFFPLTPVAIITENSYDGFDYRVLLEFSRIHNFTWNIEVIQVWGDSADNETSQTYLGKLKDVNYHIGNPTAFITYNRYLVYDYSISSGQTHIRFLTPAPNRRNELWSVFSPFTSSMWIAYVGFIIFNSFAIYFFSGVQSLLKLQYKLRVSFRGYVSALINSISVGVALSIPNTGQGGEKHLITWLFMTSSLLITAYNCNLASFLTFPLYETPINTLEELLESGLHWGSVFDYWIGHFRQSSNPVLQKISKRYFNTQDPQQLNILARERKLAVPVDYFPSGSVFPADFLETNTVKRFILMKDNAMTQLLAFIFHKNSPLLELFNQHLIRLIESGVIEQWERELVDLHDLDLNTGFKQVIRPLKIRDVAGSYVLLALGIVISSAVFLFEIVLKQYSILK